MRPKRFATGTIVAALLALTGCATSPEDEQRRQDMEADIDEIMSYELDETEVGGPRNCLFENQYRNFRMLGDRHLLFEGRNDKQWINVLRGRCLGIDDDSIFIMRLSMSRRVCDKDQFEVADRIGVGMGGATCVLGDFKPVVKAQVQEIEERLEMR